MSDEVEVEYLPTVGTSYSIKTCKQGRVGSIYDNTKADALLVGKRSGTKVAIGNRNLRKMDTSALIFNAKRIINFKLSTPRQIALAVKLIKLIEEGGVFTTEAMIISSITRSLSNRYKEF